MDFTDKIIKLFALKWLIYENFRDKIQNIASFGVEVRCDDSMEPFPKIVPNLTLLHIPQASVVTVNNVPRFILEVAGWVSRIGEHTNIIPPNEVRVRFF